MADLIIKPNSATGDKLILQDRAGGAVLTTASSGATLGNSTQDNITRLGAVTTGTLGSGVDISACTVTQDAWFFGRSTSSGTTYSNAVIDFDVQRYKGSNITESAGTITVATAGLYWINTMLTCHGTADDFDWYLNGAKITGVQGGRHYDSDGHNYHLVQMSTLVQMSASHTIGVLGDSANVYGTGMMSIFQGFRVGAIA